MADGGTAKSCSSAPRTQTAAVIWYSGRPNRRPARSAGGLIGESARTNTYVWKKARKGKTGIAVQARPCAFAIKNDESDISATSNSSNFSIRQNVSDGGETRYVRSMPAGLTDPSRSG